MSIRKVLAFIFSFALSVYTFSQTPEILLFKVDSCRMSKDTLGVARAFFGLVKHYDKVGDDAKLSQMLDSTLKYARLSGNQKAFVSAQTFYASYISDKGNHDEAIEVYRNIYKGYLEIGDTAKAADMLLNIGMEFNNKGLYSDALREEIAALKIREKIGDLSNIAKYYQLIGEVYKQLGQKEKWREYFLKADSLARKDELYANFFTRIGIMNDMGGFYEYDGDLEKAKITYEQMYELSEKEQYANGMTVALSNLVPVLKKMGLKQEALNKSLMALALSEKSDRIYHVIYDLNNVGEQYLDIGKPNNALPYFLRAEKLAEDKAFPLERMQSWKGLYKSYKNIGDYRKALAYFEQEAQLSDSLKGVEVKRNVAELETRYETEKKEQQIRELSLRSELDKKKLRTLLGLVFASVLMIILLFYIIRIRRKAIIQQRELIAKQREVAYLNQEKLKFEIDQKNRELSSLALQMASKTEFINEIKSKIDAVGVDKIIREIEVGFNSDMEWEAFRRRFEEVHPSFFKLLMKQFPDLTPGELKLCALLQLNLTTKEIANINNITIAAVDKSRNRLRKKLGLAPEESLNNFLTRF